MFTPFQFAGLLAEHDVLAGGAVDQLHEVGSIPDAEIQAEIPSLCRESFFLAAGQLFTSYFQKITSSVLLTAMFSVMVSRQRRPKLPSEPNILVYSNALALYTLAQLRTLGMRSGWTARNA